MNLEVDARWSAIEPLLNQDEKDLILWFGGHESNHLLGLDAPPKEKLIAVYSQQSGLAPDSVREMLESLIEKQYFGVVFNDHIFLNVVGYPCDELR